MLNVQPELWLTTNARPAMVSVPLRAGPVVGATANWTAPFPFPLPPPVIVIHGALLVAVQSHAATVVTATMPEPPAAATEDDSGLMLKLQPELWLTANARPAMVSVPLRAGPAFGATANWTVPLPLRLPPLAIVIHGALLAAVQSHPAAVVTATAPEPPVCATEDDSGFRLKLQPLPCVTVKTCWAIRSVPVRVGPSQAATRNATVAGPVPDGADVIDIQAVSLCAVHWQAASVVTLIEPDPPAAPTACEAGAMPTLQPAP
jgi:hypothetical protein